MLFSMVAPGRIHHEQRQEKRNMSTAEPKVPVLLPGQRLRRDEFMRRWEALPELKRAELIGGLVYMPGPVSLDHGDHVSFMAWWLNSYAAATPGCRAAINATWFIWSDAPQPDVTLRILPEYGGRTRQEGLYGVGAPELLVEVCVSGWDYELQEKLDVYQKAGVEEYLAVLVGEQEVRWHRLRSGAFELLSPAADGTLRSVVFPGLWLQPQALLSPDLAQLGATLQKGLLTPEHVAFVALLANRRAR
jgi:Uma2 family endonuclease